MTPAEWATAAGDIALNIGFVVLILFTVIYGARGRWRDNGPARALFLRSLSMSAIVVLGVLSIWFGREWPGREWVRLAAHLFFMVTSSYLLYELLWGAAKRHRSRIEPDGQPGVTDA